MAFKLNATAYQQELRKSDPTSIDQIIAKMQRVSPEAKSAAYSKLAAKYAKVPQNVATLFAAYPHGVSLPVARVVSQDTFLNYSERNFAPVMDMGDDAFVVMDTNTGLLHQFNRKANAVCEGAGADFNSVLKDMKAEETWRASVMNLKSTFSGLKGATECFKFSDANLQAAKAAKAKIQNALDIVAKEGWDENKPYTLGLGASVESICKVKNSLISAEKATAALESMMDKEILGLEGLDIDWQAKWNTVKEWFGKFWKAIKDFFQSMWIKIRSYIGPDRDLYKTMDTVNKAASEAGLKEELDKLGKSFTFDATTGTFVFPDEVKQETIEAFKAKISALPEDKKTILKKMLDPNYKEEIKVTTSGGLDEGKTSGKITPNPGQDPKFEYKHESETVQNSMYAVECLCVAIEALDADIPSTSFVPYDVTKDLFETITDTAAVATLGLAVLKDFLSNGVISKKEVDKLREKPATANSKSNKYGDIIISGQIDPNTGKMNYDIKFNLHQYKADESNAWNITQFGQFIQDCDKYGIPSAQTGIDDAISLGDYILQRVDVVKFADDVTAEDIEYFKNYIITAVKFLNEALKLGVKIVAHALKLRAACMRAMRELSDGVFKKAVMEAK